MLGLLQTNSHSDNNGNNNSNINNNHNTTSDTRRVSGRHCKGVQLKTSKHASAVDASNYWEMGVLRLLLNVQISFGRLWRELGLAKSSAHNYKISALYRSHNGPPTLAADVGHPHLTSASQNIFRGIVLCVVVYRNICRPMNSRKFSI